MKVDARLEGDREFRSALDRAVRDMSPELAAAQTVTGKALLLPQMRAAAPRRSGRLASGYDVETRGHESEITNRQPYGAGVEWGRRGKWAGFAGSPPRVAGRVLEANGQRLADAILHRLRGVASVFGWFRGW